VLLVSAPYALKAGDAQTLGGLPASAFVLATPTGKSGTAVATAGTAGNSSKAVTEAAITGTGKTNYLPLWTSPTNLGESLLYETGTEIGINTITPGATLGVKGNAIFASTTGPEALHVTQTGTGSGVVASTNATEGVGVSGTSSSTTSSAIGGIGVFGVSSNPSGYGVEGASGNVGVYGTGGTISSATGIGVEGSGNQYGVYGDVAIGTAANQAGVFGTTSVTSATTYGVEGTATATSGTEAGVFGNSSSTAGYGVYGTSPNVGLFGNGTGTGGIGVDGHGNAIGVKGVATASGGLSGYFGGGALEVAGNGNNAFFGDPGCGSGFSGFGLTTDSLSGCSNYTLIGKSSGDVYLNSTGTASIHFRNGNSGGNSNGDLATIDHSGDLSVAGKVSSSNVIAQVSAVNTIVASTCTGFLSSSNTACAVPNMTLTKTTSNPNVLVMVNIGGVYTDPCTTANFYLIIDGKIAALGTVSGNSNNSAVGFEIGSLSITSLQDLAAGSHTFQIQQASDQAGADCSDFTIRTVVSAGDGGLGSLRSLIVREF
jgi:hypothetical protein